MYGTLPVLDIHATNMKTGREVKYFRKHIELRFKNILDELAKRVTMTIDGQLIPKNRESECFYEEDDTIVTVHTRHFSLIKPDCGIPDHEYYSPVIVNIYRRDTGCSIEFKLFLTTVSVFT